MFSWTDWHFHPDIIVGLLLFQGAYLLGVGPLRNRYGWADAVPKGKATVFTIGTLTIYLALSSPLHELSDNFLFSAHMVQHFLLVMLVPPLLIWGTPGWVLAPLFQSHPLLKNVARKILSPLWAFIISSSILALWHYPALYDLTLRQHGLHVLEHLLFMAAAVLMWWPVLGSLSYFPKPSYPVQIGYLFLLSLPLGFLGAAITFSRQTLYPWYGEVPRLWGISVLTDQQVGGLIMKLLGALIFLGVMIVVFFLWYKSEERDTQDYTVDNAGNLSIRSASNSK
jgi:putative membrane protein